MEKFQRILVVENRPSVQEGARIALEGEYELTILDSGAHLVETVQKWRPELLSLSLTIPDIYPALEEIAAHRIHHKVFLMVTISGTQEARDAVVPLGHHWGSTNPLEIPYIVRRLERMPRRDILDERAALFAPGASSEEVWGQ